MRNYDCIQCRVKADKPCVKLAKKIRRITLRKMRSQNCVTVPSPPEATGLKLGFALQLAPQFQANVDDGEQYPALA